MIVVGGVIPPDDVPTLLEMGAAAVFPPGTVIAEAALDPAREAVRAARALMASRSTGAVDVAALVEGVRAGRRASISRAITLVESGRADHRVAARELLTELTDPDIDCVRVGISGVPGVGKSTFIETLGTQLTGQGQRVGVLAVDPSSVRTGGSVLGDKTRIFSFFAYVFAALLCCACCPCFVLLVWMYGDAEDERENTGQMAEIV